MLILKNCVIITCVFYIVWVQGENCEPIYKLPKWALHGSETPGYLRLGLIKDILNYAEPALGVQVENRTENITLTLFANPFILDKNCPDIRNNYSNLRRFHISHEIFVGGDERQTFYFAKVFTGCYYAELTNAKGKKWIWNGVFYNTSYHYHDTMLKCKQPDFKSKSNRISKILKAEVEIPLTCLKLRCQLYALKKITMNTIDDVKSGLIQATEECWLINAGNGEVPHISCNRSDRNLMLDATPVIEKYGYEGWSTNIKWKVAKTLSTFYYLSFQEYTHNCNMTYGDLMTWEPVAKIGGISYGF